MHYTGKSWGNKGIAGYYKDGNTLTFPFTVEVTYWVYVTPPSDSNTSNASNASESSSAVAKVQKTISQDYYITVVPNMEPALKNTVTPTFKGPKVKILIMQYKAYMISLGLDFLTIDNTALTYYNINIKTYFWF